MAARKVCADSESKQVRRMLDSCRKVCYCFTISVARMHRGVPAGDPLMNCSKSIGALRLVSGLLLLLRSSSSLVEQKRPETSLVLRIIMC